MQWINLKYVLWLSLYCYCDKLTQDHRMHFTQTPKQQWKIVLLHNDTSHVSSAVVYQTHSNFLAPPFCFRQIQCINIPSNKYWTIKLDCSSGVVFVWKCTKKMVTLHGFVLILVVMWFWSQKDVIQIASIDIDKLWCCSSPCVLEKYRSKAVDSCNKYTNWSISRSGVTMQTLSCSMLRSPCSSMLDWILMLDWVANYRETVRF